jgi:hypothetical protein
VSRLAGDWLVAALSRWSRCTLVLAPLVGVWAAGAACVWRVARDVWLVFFVHALLTFFFFLPCVFSVDFESKNSLDECS